MTYPGIVFQRVDYLTQYKPVPETDVTRMNRIGNEAQAEQNARYAHWETLARQMLGDERDPFVAFTLSLLQLRDISKTQTISVSNPPSN